MRTILVVDDEPAIILLIRHRLEHDGFRVLTAENGIDAIITAKSHHPDLIILDLMLPGIVGLEVLRELRTHSTVPIIILSARKEEVDRVVGLELGADDYVVKPFSVRELSARVKAMFRRQETRSIETDLTWNGIAINLDRREATVQGRPVNLTSTEFELLSLLLRNPGRVFSRQDLLRQVWGYEVGGDARTVNVHIKNLREKLGEEGQGEIETVRGVGYRMRNHQR